MKRVLLSTLCCFFVLAHVSLACAAKPLRSPWDLRHVKVTGAAYECPAIVHLSRDLTTDGFYADSKSSIIDPVKWKAYNESSGPYKNLGNQAVAAADAFRTTGSRAAAECAVTLLNTAADDGVFTGKMSSRQAYYVQGWVLGAMAIAYLKVRDAGVESHDKAGQVTEWMKSVARQTMEFYDTAKAKPGGEAQNNHLYWAGVEIAAVGIAANDRSLFQWAMDTYKNGVDQITPDGTLPLEMKRGQRALHYHLYALSPLVYLAEFGEVNGLQLFKTDQFAMKKLVHRCVAGLDGSGYFDQATGIKQDTPNGPPTAEEISWAPIWNRRFQDDALSALIGKAESLSYMYLGGLPPA
ncbi:MAG TPA: alginate lyase family protein [Terracidiphilus sp.]|jgi:poly(beta-D-mannuronate) lyase|nr:alginate lyase family protein [Terracidiphilus sp.]